MKPRTIHLQLTHVHGADTRNATKSASRYIAGNFKEDLEGDRRAERALAYILGTGRHEAQGGRVAARAFVCVGNHSSAKIWKELDASFRTKTGAYSRKGGNRCKKGDEIKTSGSPRLASFADALFPPELSEKQKIEIGLRFAEDHRDRYGCAVEVAWHCKNSLIDHLHLLITSRKVDENGVGAIIRDFNGVSSMCDPNGLRDGKKRLAGHAEWARGRLAELFTEATGIEFDARSFKRQGRQDEPTPWIPRQRLRTEKRDGTNTSMEHRKRLLAKRAADESAGQVGLRASGRSSNRSSGERQGIGIESGVITRTAAAPKSVGVMPVAASISPPIPGTLHLSGARDDEEIAERIREQVDRELRAEGDAYVQEQRKYSANLAARVPETDWSYHLFGRSAANTHPIQPAEKASIPPKHKLPAPVQVSEESPQNARFWMFGDGEEDEENEKRKRAKAGRAGASSMLPDEAAAPRREDLPELKGAAQRAPVKISIAEGPLDGTLPVPGARDRTTRVDGRREPVAAEKRSASAHDALSYKKEDASKKDRGPADGPRDPLQGQVRPRPRLHRADDEKVSRSSEERPGQMPVSPESREIAVALSTLIFRRIGNYGPVTELAGLAQLEAGDFRVVVNARIAATRDISDRKYFDYVRSISFKSHNATTKRLSSKILSKLEEKAAAPRGRSSFLQREIDME